MVMEKNKLQEYLDIMGISYTHTATRATAQSQESRGHYNITGDFIEDEVVLNVEPDGIVIESIPPQTKVCEHCNLVVDNPPMVLCKKRKSGITANIWTANCKTCKKDMDFASFIQGYNKPDK